MSLSKVLEVARGELGQTENPAGSNRVKYWDKYDPKMQGQPWCVAFLWWVFQEAGERMAFFGGGKTASCSMLLRWYREQGLTVPVEDVQVGDIVLYNFHNESSPEHCGLVTEASYLPDRLISIWSIEGNTTAPNGAYSDQSNGGCVAERKRFPYQIVAVCRSQYKAEETGETSPPPAGGPPPLSGEAKDDITGHWAEEDIRWCVEHGFMKGYPDGSFRPDQPVTRAELATVIRRLAEEKEDDLK